MMAHPDGPGSRVFDRCVRDGNGCLIWTGSINSNGYGQISVGGRLVVAHRVAYEAAKGAIADGLQLDHLCRNRACCNPDHLDPVTNAENMRRAWSAKQRTHCKRGHEFTPDNTLKRANGRRRCLICKRAEDLRYYHGKK